MKASVALLLVLGLIQLNSSTAAAGELSPAMSWSPDSQWLSYTMVNEPGRQRRPPGWLFDTSSDREADRQWPALDAIQAVAGRSTYQIWTTRRDGQSTVLIEESPWPLSTPAWGTEGRSIAFCRFVPLSLESEAAFPRGRFEVVVQDGLDRKRVVWSLPEFELDLTTRAAFPHVRPAWSADGDALAVPVPGRQPGITVVTTVDHKVLLSVPSAYCPVWSPDGTRLAFIRKAGNSAKVVVVERQGSDFAAPHDVAPTGPVMAYPGWGGDGRSVLFVAERPTARSREVDLVRRYLDGPDAVRAIPLVPQDAMHRGAVVRGITIDFDREGDHCVFSVDYLGRDSAVVTALPGERQILRPFHPLDVSQRVGAVAISPDGQTVAVRFGPADKLTPPAVCDWNSERNTTLFVPDRSAKRVWSDRLASVARELLAGDLPKIAVNGQVAERPTLLPLPGELPSDNPIRARVARIARLGASLDHFGVDDADPMIDPTSTATDIELRLFFLYLAGDYTGAGKALDALDNQLTVPDLRLALLSVRAQILWAQGQPARAQDVIDYLQAAQGTAARRIEETPFGPVITQELTPSQAWTRHLAQKAAAPDATKSQNEAAQPPELPEQPFHFPLIPPEPQPLEGRAADAPLGPVFRRFDGLER